MELVLVSGALPPKEKVGLVELVQLLEQLDEPLDELHLQQAGVVLPLRQYRPEKPPPSQLPHLQHGCGPLVRSLGSVLR